MQPAKPANFTKKDPLDFIQAHHQVLLDVYPGLQLRWVRIYGKRWDHLYGDAGSFSGQALRTELNSNLGLCLDNPELIPAADLDTIMAELKEQFNDKNLV